MWERVEDDEHQELPRKWEHQNSGDTVKVERYSNGTWDTKHNERLIENFDTLEEAVERGNKLVGES